MTLRRLRAVVALVAGPIDRDLEPGAHVGVRRIRQTTMIPPRLKIGGCCAVLLLAACGKTPEPAAASSATPAPLAVAQAAGAVDLPAPPPGVSGVPVDTCALLDSAAALDVIGKPYKEAEAQPAQGSLLGQCNWFGDKGVLMLSARPAAEFRGTVDYAGKKGGFQPVEGLGQSAAMTPAGLMIQPEGKPYFLLIYSMAGGKFNPASALDIGRKLKL